MDTRANSPLVHSDPTEINSGFQHSWHGHRWYRAKIEIDDGRETLLLRAISKGGITL